MAVTDSMPDLTNTLPIFSYGVSLKDADNNDASVDTIGGDPRPMFTFDIVNVNSSFGNFPTGTDALMSGMFSALKTFFNGFDWTTFGATLWTQDSVPTPVTMSSVVVTQWDASTTDVTPA